MLWTEAEIDELINSVQRDLALGRTKPEFWLKLENHGVSRHLAEKVISKKSYIITEVKNVRGDYSNIVQV